MKKRRLFIMGMCAAFLIATMSIAACNGPNNLKPKTLPEEKKSEAQQALAVALTPYAEVSAGRIIPIPLLPPAFAKQLDALLSNSGGQSALIIDPLLSGLSVQLTIRL